jgi:two-component system nitrate/nitrite response regulator NarL
MVSNRASTLIVSRPGRLRDGLRTLLSTQPQIMIVGEADDSPSAQQLVIEHNPALVLLDSDLYDGEVQSMLGWLKGEQPHVRCLVLASNLQKQDLARTYGADGVLLKGYALPDLFAAIEQLVPSAAGTQ